MVRSKVRIRFRKLGDLRLISHHDLMRCFERMLRRAALPYHSTAGFNPKPRLIFALSLPLGIIGCDEVAELELNADLCPEVVHARLVEQAPSGLEILTVERIDNRTTAHVRQVRYALSVPAGSQAGLAERMRALLDAANCWIERRRPHPRQVDVRSYVDDIRVQGDVLEMDLRVTPNGTARPDEVLEVLGLGELLRDGAVLQRTHVQLEDDVAKSTAFMNPDLDASTALREGLGSPGQPGPPNTPAPAPQGAEFGLPSTRAR
jgi:radical SAM-linked protein